MRKVLQIDNEAMTMKFIQKDKGANEISICYISKEKLLVSQLELDYQYKSMQCELIINYNANTISFLLSNRENNKDSIKGSLNMITNKTFNLDKEVILNEIKAMNSIKVLQDLKYNIIPYIKISIDNRIRLINASVNTVFNLFNDKCLKDYKFLLQEIKDIHIIKSMKYNTLEEYHSSLDKNIGELLTKAKSFITNRFKDNIIQEKLKPKFFFDYSIANTQYKSKENEYLYINNSYHQVLMSHSPFHLYIMDKKLNNEISLLYKNDSDYVLKQSNNATIISKDSLIYIGINDPSSNLGSFGVEQGKGYTYIGPFAGSQYNGLGILMTPEFIYRGAFINGRKNDAKGMILIKPNIKYTGGIVNDSLQGKGVYEYQGDSNSAIQSINAHWKDNRIEGDTHVTFINKDTYEGKITSKPIMKWQYNSNNKLIPVMTVDYDSNPIDYKY